MAKTFVCDVMPGGGKSSAVIRMMNERTDRRFIYIAPYLDEGDRIVESCKSRNFISPTNRGDGKLGDLHRLLASGENVSSTHALFSAYNERTIELIKDGEYCLIMDEAFQIADIFKYTKDDIKTMIDSGLIDVSGSKVRWLKDDYGGVFSDLKKYAEEGHLQSFKNLFFYWYYPPEVFRAFSEAYVLTYMFDAQFLKYYFDVNNIEYEKIWVDKDSDGYRFVDYMVVPQHGKTLKDKIHIVSTPRINSIGEDRTALSATWYRDSHKKYRSSLAQMKKNIKNFFKHISKSKVGESLWTVYHGSESYVEDDGYKGSFVPFNTRATNAYRDRNAIAYCVNVFPDPNYVAFFRAHDCAVDADGYSLSEMIQLIWRSAIREGKEIWVYIPSKRMRTLLEDWLSDLAGEKDSVVT